MSQVAFKLGGVSVEVVGGWDPHDEEFVLYVFDLRPNAVYSLLWSNICDFATIDRTSTSRLRDRLEKYLGFHPPAGFWERVERKEGPSVRYEWNGVDWFKGLSKDSSFDLPMAFEVPIVPQGSSAAWLLTA